jgi:hypothetical protein
MDNSLVWSIVPIVNDNEKYLQAILLDSDLNIQYSYNFLNIDVTNPILNDSIMLNYNPIIANNYNNLIYTDNKSNKNSLVKYINNINPSFATPLFAVMIDNYNNLIFTSLNISQSLIDVYRLSYQNAEHFTIKLSSSILSDFLSNSFNFIKLNILSNNNILITLITNSNIYYYIFDETFKVINGITPYFGIINNDYNMPITNITTAENRICIGNIIYDNNFNIINPNIVPISLLNYINYDTHHFNIYSYSFIQYLNNYLFILLHKDDTNTDELILCDKNGNVINSILYPYFTTNAKFLGNNFNFPSILNFISFRPVVDTYCNISISLLNFTINSYTIFFNYSYDNDELRFYTFFLNYQNNILYMVFNYSMILALNLNTYNIINTIEDTQFMPALLSNNNILSFKDGTFSLYDKNLNLIKSNTIYSDFQSYDYTNLHTFILPFIIPSSNYQNKKNMNITYNPLLCKSYTANEILDST